MGSNTLNARSNGQTILDTFFNDFNTAFGGDFIGRNNSGVPTPGQNLGTTAVPWGVVNTSALVLNGTAVDASKIVSPVNRIISGLKRASSNQPAFIIPNGAAASAIISGATTSLTYDVNGTAYEISTDITKGSLTLAPASQNTCLVNDALAVGQEDTRLWGEPEHRKTITVDAAGSNISGKIGKFCAFKIGTEYFLALVESATVLSHARRGYFYDSSINPLNRSKFSDNDTITLMSLGWVFADIDQTTIDVSYNNPVWSNVAPNSPATGDYWYDLSNREWKRYDGATFQIINRVLIGNVVIDTSNCVAARCVDFYAASSQDNTLSLAWSTTEIVISDKLNAKVNVMGNVIDFGEFLQGWNITTDLAGSHDMYNATEQVSMMYYLYLADDGRAKISDISPYYRGDLQGRYHPHNPWRCVGMAYNDASSDLTVAHGFYNQQNDWRADTAQGYGSTNVYIRRYTNFAGLGAGVIYLDSVTLGASATVFEPGTYEIEYADQGTADVPGISLNGDGLTSYTVLPFQQQLSHADTTGGVATQQEITKKFKIGDVLKPHTGLGNVNGTSQIYTYFGSRKVSNEL